MCCYTPFGSKEMWERAHPPIVFRFSKYRRLIPLNYSWLSGIFIPIFNNCAGAKGGENNAGKCKERIPWQGTRSEASEGWRRIRSFGKPCKTIGNTRICIQNQKTDQQRTTGSIGRRWSGYLPLRRWVKRLIFMPEGFKLHGDTGKPTVIVRHT